ncbi:MAG TPA: hypothetical protein VGY54_08585 [Polyangiaceae bacterium]|jgi:hypothetical protein|nr:hypothetical protein [Polyangiaceae bacterium]
MYLTKETAIALASLLAFGCSSGSSSPSPDGGIEAGGPGPTSDGGADVDGGACTVDPALFDIEYDFNCTGTCPSSGHYALTPASGNSCGVTRSTIFTAGGTCTTGPSCTGQLVGSLTIILVDYHGVGTYTFSGTSPAGTSAFSVAVVSPGPPACPPDILTNTQTPPQDASGISCTFVVTGDCAQKNAHNAFDHRITGTFHCTDQSNSSGDSCTYDGTFNLGDCLGSG